MYNKILAPLDGSKIAECSLGHIKEIATGCHVSEVVLLRVIEDSPPVYAQFGNRSQIEEEVKEKENEQKRLRQMAEQYLNEVNDNLKKQGVSAQNVIIQAEENQSPADIILEYAGNNDIDLITMSTHGRSGVTRWAFGSVADRVVRHSKIPVLTIAPAGCRP
jgi:nucleotide-binding universal stress UspA family protein